MKCICGSNVFITPKTLLLIDGKGVIVCNKCKRAYDETEFSEHEIEVAYWNNSATNK